MATPAEIEQRIATRRATLGQLEAAQGAASEDGSTAANTRQIISAVQANQSTFAPRNNVLDQYASYTYNIGWYLMTPEQYTAL